MLTAQKHPGATGVQSKIIGILTVRAAQDTTLLPRGRQERAVGISLLQVECGVRSFMGLLLPGQLYLDESWKEMVRRPNGDN